MYNPFLHFLHLFLLLIWRGHFSLHQVNELCVIVRVKQSLAWIGSHFNIVKLSDKYEAYEEKYSRKLSRIANKNESKGRVRETKKLNCAQYLEIHK